MAQKRHAALLRPPSQVRLRMAPVPLRTGPRARADAQRESSRANTEQEIVRPDVAVKGNRPKSGSGHLTPGRNGPGLPSAQTQG